MGSEVKSIDELTKGPDKRIISTPLSKKDAISKNIEEKLVIIEGTNHMLSNAIDGAETEEERDKFIAQLNEAMQNDKKNIPIGIDAEDWQQKVSSIYSGSTNKKKYGGMIKPRPARNYVS